MLLDTDSERPAPLGSIRYLDAKTTPLTPPICGASGTLTEVSISMQPPRISNISTSHFLKDDQKPQKILASTSGMLFPDLSLRSRFNNSLGGASTSVHKRQSLSG
uniref:Uncharacterized protein n=1 Tax=Romanomermis culicivorax TaxID=13658 RepID=A0A915KUJ7_ROMCU